MSAPNQPLHMILIDAKLMSKEDQKNDSTSPSNELACPQIHMPGFLAGKEAGRERERERERKRLETSASPANECMGRLHLSMTHLVGVHVAQLFFLSNRHGIARQHSTRTDLPSMRSFVRISN